jgi:single-strand DNA-binding protein
MINKVILVGRAGKDAELHTTKSDKKVVRFTLATWENYKDDKEESGWRTETDWHNIVIWGAAAETISRNVKKGSWVYVEGSIRTRSYEDKEGTTKWITEIVGFGKTIHPEKKVEEIQKDIKVADISSKEQTDIINQENPF